MRSFYVLSFVRTILLDKSHAAAVQEHLYKLAPTASHEDTRTAFEVDWFGTSCVEVALAAIKETPVSDQPSSSELNCTKQVVSGPESPTTPEAEVGLIVIAMPAQRQEGPRKVSV